MRMIITGVLLVSLALPAQAGVFLNEVFINPPGSSLDDTREYIELMGTPGMKLDGYAVALINGGLTRFYPLGSIPPRPLPDPEPEIDEFFSLDGLALGPNGVLVIGIGIQPNYPLLVPDSNFRQWSTLWNGFRDTTGKLSNDGANTLLLLRNRPGTTQESHPTPPDSPSLIWGKDRNVDDELFTPVIDPQDGLPYDQFGDGSIDRGQPNNIDGNTFDAKGALTLADLSDDLEVVDELSYEHDRGWEYDLDNRLVDVGSASAGLPERRVHALDDPQGINPDCLTRVDYRTKGPGWAPEAGATGGQPNGNNWQDTATEQWVRGESIISPSIGQGPAPRMFFDNSANIDPNSIQPYLTNVPRWLSDASGADYDFTTTFTYQIMAGRVNPLAVAYIPGDADRDGDCDGDDITKMRGVFGDDDWIFSNSFAESADGDSGDPATQTRPWDVDGTGANGIEPSDLQWTLNFQGDATGRVVGRTYDSPTPSAVGVHLNPSLPVVCEVTTTTNVPSGRPLSGLHVGDTFEVTVLGRVSGGANNTAGQQNGIMQFVNDVLVAGGGIVRATDVEALPVYIETRLSLVSFNGAGGDLGVARINGYTTSFAQGLAGAAGMYRVTFEAVGEGSTTVTIGPSQYAKFAASTPNGLKVGHTDNHGNPGAAAYPALGVTVVAASLYDRGDANCDGAVDFFDIDPFLMALFNLGTYQATYCGGSTTTVDVDCSGGIDFFDIDPFLACLFGTCPDCP